MAMLDASLLDHFQRSLTLLADETPPHAMPDVPRDARLDPLSIFYRPPPQTSHQAPMLLCTVQHPRPPTPPPSRQPNIFSDKRSTRLDARVRPVPVHTARRTQRVWHGRSRRQEAEESVFRDQNKRTRFVAPDAEDNEEGAWRTNAVNATRRTSGPLRSILQNKHDGATPYQKVPVRHAVRWA